MGERNLFFRGMAQWLGFEKEQIPFSVAERAGGGSGWSGLQLLKLALTALTAFSTTPLHLITLAGAIFGVFAVILGVQTLYLKSIGAAVSGFSTVILLLLIIGTLLMFALGVIGEYLARIYEEVKARPKFIFSDEIISDALLSDKNNR
jgi:hypothetical protein